MRRLIDTELTIALQNGDVEAFDQLYWRYYSAVYFNILKLTKSPVFAEDILQEVFITLWEKRHLLENEKSIAGWLFTISFNRSVDVLRRSAKEASAVKSLPALQGQDAEQQLLNELKHELLDQALVQLSAQKQKVFKLCKLEGKTYEEAAKELQISKHTVKEYLSDAVLFVRSYIRNHPDLAISYTGVLLLLSEIF